MGGSLSTILDENPYPPALSFPPWLPIARSSLTHVLDDGPRASAPHRGSPIPSARAATPAPTRTLPPSTVPPLLPAPRQAAQAIAQPGFRASIAAAASTPPRSPTVAVEYSPVRACSVL